MIEQATQDILNMIKEAMACEKYSIAEIKKLVEEKLNEAYAAGLLKQQEIKDSL